MDQWNDSNKVQVGMAERIPQENKGFMGPMLNVHLQIMYIASHWRFSHVTEVIVWQRSICHADCLADT